jgi:hypothetical protein
MIKSMSIKAKVTTRLRVHDLHYGSATDIAHLNQNKIRGYATMQVASALSHKMSTFMNDVTEMYTGGSNVSIWNLQATSTWEDSRAPKIGNTAFVPRPPREAELKEYCRTMDWDPSKPSNIENARHHIR